MPTVTTAQLTTRRTSLGLPPAPIGEVQAAVYRAGERAAVESQGPDAAVPLVPATETDRLAAEIVCGATPVNGRPLEEYLPVREHPGHGHRTDDLVGYVIRETIGPGGEGALWRDDDGNRIDAPDSGRLCGYDVAVVVDAGRYDLAVERFHAYRRAGRYAVADMLYRCGCRSGF